MQPSLFLMAVDGSTAEAPAAAQTLRLDMIGTMAIAGIVVVIGSFLRQRIPLLGRFNIPAPVLGGVACSLAVLAARHWELCDLEFDESLRTPLQNAFFTAVGFGASFKLLRGGGGMMALLLALTAAGAVIQNVVGTAVAVVCGQHPLLGVLCGSVTLTGGPATGLAFAPQFEVAGVPGADAIALAAATGGIIAAGLLGAPLATMLIDRRGRGDAALPCAAASADAYPVSGVELKTQLGANGNHAQALVAGMALLLSAMWAGRWVSDWFTSLGVFLPSYIGAMIVAATIRNVDDVYGWIGLPHRAIGDLGNLALVFFLALALMTLDLSRLSAVAAPLAAILGVQVAVTAAFCAWPVYQILGGDYNAAVTTSGYYGFMIGTTPVAIANMDSIVRRYGPAPRAFLTVPIVGAFFLDIVNAMIIQGWLNAYR